MLSLKQKKAEKLDVDVGPVENELGESNDGEFSFIGGNSTLIISSDEEEDNHDGNSKVSSITSQNSGCDEKSQDKLSAVRASSCNGITSPVNAALSLKTYFPSKKSFCHSVGQSSVALSMKPNSSDYSSNQNSMSDGYFDYETEDAEGNPLINRLLQDLHNSKAKKSICLSHANPAGGEVNSEPLTENPFIDMSSSEIDRLQLSFMSSRAGSFNYEEDVLHSSGRSTSSAVFCMSGEDSSGLSYNFNSPQKKKKLKISLESQSVCGSPNQDCSEVFDTQCFKNNSSENSVRFSSVYCKSADNPPSRISVLLPSTFQEENSQNAIDLPSTGRSNSSSASKDSQLGLNKVSSLVNTSAPVSYGVTPELDSLHFESSNANKPAKHTLSDSLNSGTLAQDDSIATTHHSTSAPYIQQECSTSSLNEEDRKCLKLKLNSWLNEVSQKSHENSSSLRFKCKENPPSIEIKPVQPSKKIDPCPYFGNYRAPKKNKPRPYVTNQMYLFLERKLASQYGLEARLKAEEFVSFMCAKVESVIRSKSNYHTIVKELCKRMANLKLVKRQIDFHIFIEKYLPTEFRVKAIPCFGCKAGPPSMSYHDLYRNISPKK